ncbi:hypothetical protein [Sphingobacterium daejeonense]|uniref:hypothetical protein n=1 Tax=Sphingobacterium daejeonense TaxID=371142 RepID=UPI003D31D929
MKDVKGNFGTDWILHSWGGILGNKTRGVLGHPGHNEISKHRLAFVKLVIFFNGGATSVQK